MNQVTTQTRTADAGILASTPARRALAIAAFVILTAISARLSVPLPGGLIPISLQSLVVLLAGMLLGPVLGASAMAAYLAAGAAGLPVFVAGGGMAYLAGPTGGYLLAFPAAAAITGLLAARAQQSAARDGSEIARAVGLTLAAVAGTIAVFLGGWAQLSFFTGAETAFYTGVVPFLLGGVAKIAVAVVVTMRMRRPAGAA